MDEVNISINRTPNWKDDLNLSNRCGGCVYYVPRVKNGVLTARGKCELKGKYKQRIESCSKYTMKVDDVNEMLVK